MFQERVCINVTLSEKLRFKQKQGVNIRDRKQRTKLVTTRAK